MENEKQKPSFAEWKADMELRANLLAHDENRIGRILTFAAFLTWLVWR